jgi:hypothetical protein
MLAWYNCTKNEANIFGLGTWLSHWLLASLLKGDRLILIFFKFKQVIVYILTLYKGQHV